MEPEDIAVGVGAVVEGCDEVFERGASVVCEFLEENLRFFLCEGAHIGRLCSSGLIIQFPRECIRSAKFWLEYGNRGWFTVVLGRRNFF
jgi:hypothetical protein